MSARPDDSRFSVASSHYSQSQETYDEHEDSSHLVPMSQLRAADNGMRHGPPAALAIRPPPIPRRSSQRISRAASVATAPRPLSIVPASPLPRRNSWTQAVPRLDATGSWSPSPSTVSRQSSAGTPEPPIGPHTHLLRTDTSSSRVLSQHIPDAPHASVVPDPPKPQQPRSTFRPLSSVAPGFAGTAYARENSTMGSQQGRLPPQPAFLFPASAADTGSAISTLRSQSSVSDLGDLDRYHGTIPGHKVVVHKLASSYSLDPDPDHWGMNHELNYPEPDDDLHNPDPNRDRAHDRHLAFSKRGLYNLGCLTILLSGLLALFAGYPVITYFTQQELSTLGGYNLGGINASGQVPELPSHRGLIDVDTPKSAYTRTSLVDGSTYELVFSDEFNANGRSFYPGDDPYWEAVDLHYWSTNNLEWYDPAQVTTTDGSLRIELAAKSEHRLNYTGGMLSTWNKFCFTGGYIEANVSLPGSSKTYGLWPAVWTMGNLGRAGYGASLEGTWPYTYNTCDVGTLANQTDPVTNLPAAAHVGGVSSSKGEMSYLPGQRLSACTCPSESDGTDGQQLVHPGPKNADGSYVGRSAPEIDVFEAQVDQNTLIGAVSQSGQWAPFNAAFVWDNSSANLIITDPKNSKLNTFVGNEWQQTTSVVTNTNPECYTQTGGCFSTYGFEYVPGTDGYIQWVNDAAAVWQVKAAGMGPDSKTEIGQRPVPQEPMYILANLGMSYNFGPIDWDHLVFPAYMLVDYIRVYQRSDRRNIGCDPPDFPTAKYINTYIEAYTNPNLTTWVDDYKQRIPKNKLIDTC